MTRIHLRLLTLQEVMAKTSYSKTSILEWSRTGRFPAGIREGRSVRWAEHQVDEWILQRLEAAKREHTAA